MHEVPVAVLQCGGCVSCGCFAQECRLSGNYKRKKHGFTVGVSNAKGARGKIPSEYYAWSSMKVRCLKESNPRYADYGGRGIKVCDRWRDSFENFIKDMGPKPSPKHSLDRIDNNSNYEPSNCRWAVNAQQYRNRRSNVWISYKGEKMVFADLRRLLGLKTYKLNSMLDKGLIPGAEKLPTSGSGNRVWRLKKNK